MKRTLGILMILGLMACSGGAGTHGDSDQRNVENDGATITPLPVTPSTVLADYNRSEFSDYVYWHKTESKMLLDYNFFPAGTNFNLNSENKTANIPCEYRVSAGTDANVSVSAPTTPEACTDIVVNLNGCTPTPDGLIFAFDGSLEIFSEFDFNITSAGFVDTTNGEVISSDVGYSNDANLEDVNDLISERHTS